MTALTLAASGEEDSAQDHRYMARALQLAERGLYTTHPNPRVGSVVVKDNVVIGEGWHEKAGGHHAEIYALRQAGTAAAGATLYVTLEPCCHHGRTPPCSRAIIEAGISRVVSAMRDPDPRVDNGGIEELRAAGIRVDIGVAEQPARVLNRGFIRRMQAGRPWTTLKIAASLDGRTAMANGESKWITSDAARKDAHRLRARSSAILTGSGTVLKDDPSLTARIDGVTRQPLRVVLDSNLSVPSNARLFAQPGETLVFTTVADEEAHEGLSRENVSVVALPGRRGMVDLEAVVKELGRREVNEFVVEAGAVLSGAMLRRDLVDEIVVYMAPDLLGSGARGMFNL
ncbi:MAG: bifunctional diaminohydroxyphosphoribosylaminopyrimidine deaminase/5-amino-6-(5-phosphoribosylamino)uracil reductase RibD, partial [Pseudomonadota bacterium]|nr:bifunctional diaminohydroxyphosphoribosylaminopyrimidine deaminase/5-amino-6-(5-phosphoribosylamino)uracil reductase RibD [Pseudomonadota bacterium]